MRLPGKAAAFAIVRLRWWIVSAWVVLAAALLPNASRVEQRLEVSATVQRSESARAAALLATRFPSALADYAVLVIAGAPAPTTGAGRTALERIRKSIASLPEVNRTVSYLDTPDTLFTGTHGETFMVVGLATAGHRPDELMPALRQASSRVANELRGVFPALSLEWTGEIALNYDLRRVSAADAEGAERRVLPLTLILLIVAFGAVAAAFLPLVAGGLAIALSLGAAVVVTRFFPLSILLQNVVTMLGLGLGIDYALLAVARFREGLARGLPSHDAARETIEEAGHTIIVSGASVAIGFAALLFMPVNEIRSLAVGGLLVITISVLLAVTLVPALLAALGPRVNWGRIRRQVINADGSDRWRRWGKFVCARPRTVLLVAGIPLVAIAAQAARLSTNLPPRDWLPSEMESARALHRLGEMERSGIVQSIRVVVRLPDGVTWDSPTGWAALRHASEHLVLDHRVARVRSLTTTTGLITPNLQLLASMPKDLVGSLGSNDGRLALIDIFPTEAVTANAGMDFVRQLRRDGAAHLTGLAGTTMDVGGLPALNVDYESSISGRFLVVVGLVVGLTMVALLLGFRSVMIAAKAVALNLLSVATAFGAVVLVFQDGFGIRLLGLTHALGGNFPAIPVIVFAIVFGLSMDYEVFLVSRIAEARRAGMSDRDAIAEGLARTGGLITSAAAIMIVVFAAFTLGDFVLIKILGFALSVAVLVDATVVRMAIGPALLMIAGKWNWWPGESSRSRSEKSPSLTATGFQLVPDLASRRNAKAVNEREIGRGRAGSRGRDRPGGADRRLHSPASLYHNLGGGKFSETAVAAGLETFWPWGVVTGDYDNDGDEDVFITSGMGFPFYYWPNQLMMNNGNGTFQDLAAAFGIDPPAGGIYLEESVGFANRFPRRNYVDFRLTGTQSNRDAIGAVVRLWAGKTVMVRQVNPAGGYLSHSGRVLHFGLGDRSKVDRMEIRWPRGIVQTIVNPGTNTLHQIQEPAK